MGTFAEYTGEMDIPEDKRELFVEQMGKILNLGGMMQLDTIHMSGRELLLLSPVQVCDGVEESFGYNYFENRMWETVTFDGDTLDISTGKIGDREFQKVILAAYMLFEIYDEGPGLVLVNGHIIDAGPVTGWLNSILGTSFSQEKRFHIWDNLETCFLEKKQRGDCFTISHLDSDYENLYYYLLCGPELEDLINICRGTGPLTGNAAPGTYHGDVLRCKQAITGLFVEQGMQDGLRKLKVLIRAKFPLRQKMAETPWFFGETLSTVARMSLILPARVIVYLTAEHLHQDFWEEWTDVLEEVYRDEQMETYCSDKMTQWRRNKRQEPVKPVRTSDYLSPKYWYNEQKGSLDDDRLYWWSSSSDEVIIFREMDRWLKEIALRHKRILKRMKMEGGPSSDRGTYGANFLSGNGKPSPQLRRFLKIIHKLERKLFREMDRWLRHAGILKRQEMKDGPLSDRGTYGADFLSGNGKPSPQLRRFLKIILKLEKKQQIFPFRSMFFDFVQNIGKAEYRAAVKLLEDLEKESRDEESPVGRAQIKRFLSAMANRELRERYFGF